MTDGVLPDRRWCPACGRSPAGFVPGPGGRSDAACPGCWSLERHRFLSLLLDGLGPWLAGCSLVVDVAPSRQVSGQLRRLAPQAYVSLDFDPAADGRAVDVRASLTGLPLATGSTDFLLCYHVLEHVPDDAAAVREIARVLAPGGMALVQVPWEPDLPTAEDPDAPQHERVRRFGQADHVRLYGTDFEERLRVGGLAVVRTTPGEVVGADACRLMGLVPTEYVWLATTTRADHRAAGARDPRRQELGGRTLSGLVHQLQGAVTTARDLRAVADSAHEQVQDLRARLGAAEEEARERADTEERLRVRLRKARADAAKWRAAHDRLRGRLPVRLLVVAGRGLRRLSPR